MLCCSTLKIFVDTQAAAKMPPCIVYGICVRPTHGVLQCNASGALGLQHKTRLPVCTYYFVRGIRETKRGFLFKNEGSLRDAAKYGYDGQTNG